MIRANSKKKFFVVMWANLPLGRAMVPLTPDLKSRFQVKKALAKLKLVHAEAFLFEGRSHV